MSDPVVLDEQRFFFEARSDAPHAPDAALTVMLEGATRQLAERLAGLVPADHVRADAVVTPDGLTVTLTGKTEEGRRALAWFAGGGAG